jgi:hypothetical protein
MVKLTLGLHWPSVVSEEGSVTEFVSPSAELDHVDLGTAAKFNRSDLTIDDAVEIDALIPPGTTWLGG